MQNKTYTIDLTEKELYTVLNCISSAYRITSNHYCKERTKTALTMRREKMECLSELWKKINAHTRN